MSGRELSRRTDLSQSTISRMLRDELAISPDAAERLGWALTVPPAEIRDLVALAVEASEQGKVVPIRLMLQRGGVVSIQRRIRLRERNVELLKVFHCSIVPGILQTPAYIAAVMGLVAAEDGELQPAVAERLARQRQAATRSIEFVITEGCLLQGAPDAGAMVEQCEHLARIAMAHGHWRLGVVPRVHGAAALNVTQNGFDVYDDKQVFIGTTAGNTLTDDEQIVADHVARFDRLTSMAAYGDEAQAVLRRVARGYRRG